MVPRCKEVMNIKLEATAAGGGNMAAATPLAAARARACAPYPKEATQMRRISLQNNLN